MTTYATIYLNGKEFCAVHNDGYLANLGEALYGLIRRNPSYNWRDVLSICKYNWLVYIHIEYIRKNYEHCYECGIFSYIKLNQQFFWPKSPTPEFLQDGTDIFEGTDKEDWTPETHDRGWQANNNYDYNLVENHLFVKLPYKGKKLPNIAVRIDPNFSRKWHEDHMMTFLAPNSDEHRKMLHLLLNLHWKIIKTKFLLHQAVFGTISPPARLYNTNLNWIT